MSYAVYLWSEHVESETVFAPDGVLTSTLSACLEQKTLFRMHTSLENKIENKAFFYMYRLKMIKKKKLCPPLIDH